jgi:hypothetical protein
LGQLLLQKVEAGNEASAWVAAPCHQLSYQLRLQSSCMHEECTISSAVMRIPTPVGLWPCLLQLLQACQKDKMLELRKAGKHCLFWQNSHLGPSSQHWQYS